MNDIYNYRGQMVEEGGVKRERGLGPPEWNGPMRPEHKEPNGD